MLTAYRPGVGDSVHVHWLFGLHLCSGTGIITSISNQHITVRLDAPSPGPKNHPTKGVGHPDWNAGDYIIVPQVGECWHSHVRVELRRNH